MFEHTFVVPVYRSAPYLKETLQSLIHQEKSTSQIILRTVETPSTFENDFNDYLGRIKVIRAEKSQGIGGDWAAALSSANSIDPKSSHLLVTLAHSDDLYTSDYSKSVISAFQKFPHAGIAFSDSYYLRSTFRLRILLAIKWLLNPARFSWSNFTKNPVCLSGNQMKRALKYGCFIPCPTVTYHLPVIQKTLEIHSLFDPHFKTALDWKAWTQLAEKGISFVYIPKALVGLRVHTSATTQLTIESGHRSSEELELLQLLWGKRMGQWIATLFKWGQKLQKLSTSKVKNET